MTTKEIQIKECLEPIITNLGYELYDVIYEKEGKDNYLRIFINKQGGISINDCENVNNSITDILDEKDFIKNAYILEVSSIGLERRIRTNEHLKKALNEKIEVHTFKSKTFIGILKSYDDNIITIETEDSSELIEIFRNDVSKIKTIYNWEEK